MGCSGSSSVKVKSMFPWGYQGKVTIKSFRYKATYSERTKAIEEPYPKNVITVSELTWKGDTFTLTDTVSVDLETHISYDLPGLSISFKVGKDSSFVGIQNGEHLIMMVGRDQNTFIDENTRRLMLNKFTKECREFWDLARGYWVREETKFTPTQQYSTGCIKCELSKVHSRAALEEFMSKQHNILEVYDLGREFQARCYLQDSNERPLSAGVHRSSYLHMKTTEGLIIEIERELRNVIFCWSDLPEVSSHDTLKTELAAFDSASQRIRNVMAEEIKNIG